MASSGGGRRRKRGSIEELPSGALRVRVYAGVDPVTRRAHYLKETIPPGRSAAREAEKARTRMLREVDERKAPRTGATLNQLLDRQFDVGLDVDGSTKRDYLSKACKHIRPFLGSEPISRVGPEVLESLYADLRRCQDHCHGRRFIHHRTDREHECDEHSADGPCSPADPDCRSCRRMCKPHQRRPFADSGIRTVHYILSGAFASAVRWGW
jgi:integrase